MSVWIHACILWGLIYIFREKDACSSDLSAYMLGSKLWRVSVGGGMTDGCLGVCGVVGCTADGMTG